MCVCARAPACAYGCITVHQRATTCLMVHHMSPSRPAIFIAHDPGLGVEVAAYLGFLRILGISSLLA